MPAVGLWASIGTPNPGRHRMSTAPPSPPAAVRLVPLGTNGFFPTFGRQTMSFLVLGEGGALLLDAGSGVARLGEEGVRGMLDEVDHLDLVLTHYHLDHVVGLSFLTALWRGRSLRIYAPVAPLVDARTPDEALGRLLAPPLFPVALAGFPLDCEVVPYDGTAPVEAAGFPLRVRRQEHAGGSAGLRVGDLLAYATDTVADDASAELAAGVGLLLHECYATDAEAAADPTRVRGHAAISGVARIARAARPGRLLTVHHHPAKPAADLETMAAEIADLSGVDTAVPVEGLVYSLEP